MQAHLQPCGLKSCMTHEAQGEALMVCAGGGYQGRAIPVRHAPFHSVSVQDICTAGPEAA